MTKGKILNVLLAGILSISLINRGLKVVYAEEISNSNDVVEPTTEPTTVEETPAEVEEQAVVEETLIPTPVVEITVEPTAEVADITTDEPTATPTVEPTIEPAVEETAEPTLVPTEEVVEEEAVEEVPTEEPADVTVDSATAVADPEITTFAASGITVDDSCFVMNGSTLVGYDIDRCGSDVVVPAEVNGVAITDIGQMAFYRKPITSLDISAIENLNSFGFQTLCGSQLFDFVAGDLSNTTFYDGGNMGSSELDWNTYVANGIVRDDQLTIDMNQIKNWSSTFDPNNVAEVSIDWGNAGPLTYDKASGLATGNVVYNPAVMFYNYTAPSDSHYNGWDDVMNGSFGTLCVGLGISYTYQFKATFQNDDGTVLGQDWYNQNSSAVAPTTPTKAGYTFTGWDVDFSNMVQNIVVTAQYTRNPDPTVAPATPTPTPNTGRTCQDDGYPAGYYWNGTACVIDATPAPVTPTPTTRPVVVVTPNPTTPETEIAAVNENTDATYTTNPNPVVNEEVTVAEQNNTEVAKPTYGAESGTWSVYNLIAALVSMLLGIFAILSKTKNDNNEERSKGFKASAAISGMASVICFIVMENITLTPTLFNSTSILFTVLLAVSAVTFVLSQKWKTVEE